VLTILSSFDAEAAEACCGTARPAPDSNSDNVSVVTVSIFFISVKHILLPVMVLKGLSF